MALRWTQFWSTSPWTNPDIAWNARTSVASAPVPIPPALTGGLRRLTIQCLGTRRFVRHHLRRAIVAKIFGGRPAAGLIAVAVRFTRANALVHSRYDARHPELARLSRELWLQSCWKLQIRRFGCYAVGRSSPVPPQVAQAFPFSSTPLPLHTGQGRDAVCGGFRASETMGREQQVCGWRVTGLSAKSSKTDTWQGGSA